MSRTLKEAAREVIEEQIRKGLAIYVLRDGKVVEVSAKEMKSRHETAKP